MTLLTSTLDKYNGRSVDLLMFDDWKARGEAQVTQALVKTGQSGALITGFEKLVQRFMLELLTERGSMPYRPNRSCQFMLDARRGYWRTPDDVSSSFTLSLSQIKANLVDDEVETDPDDEKFENASILSVSVSKDQVVLYLSVTSLAGTTREIFYPLRTTYK